MKRMRSTLEKRYDTDFNPRSPCRERPHRFRLARWSLAISTHAPHAGSDVRGEPEEVQQAISTHAPHAGSDEDGQRLRSPRAISTHAPHAGSDGPLLVTCGSLRNFNPRSPCGERRGGRCPLLRGSISTHAPHAGSDAAARSTARSSMNFNPRSPCGERPKPCAWIVRTS